MKHEGRQMNENSAQYKSSSLSLLGTVAMGTGVMIGAGIFALTGQVAELAGGLFPIAFIVAAINLILIQKEFVKCQKMFLTI
jgi:amino acid transporter